MSRAVTTKATARIRSGWIADIGDMIAACEAAEFAERNSELQTKANILGFAKEALWPAVSCAPAITADDAAVQAIRLNSLLENCRGGSGSKLELSPAEVHEVMRLASSLARYLHRQSTHGRYSETFAGVDEVTITQLPDQCRTAGAK